MSQNLNAGDAGVEDGSWIPLIKAGRERNLSTVETQLNAWVNEPVLGGVLRSFWIFICLAVVVNVLTPLYLIASLLTVAYQAFCNLQKIDPRGRLVVITGCDSGFGFAAALQLAGKGFPVVAGCLSQQGMAQLTKTWQKRKTDGHDGMIIPVQCDVTKDDDRRRLVETTEKLLEEDAFTLLAVVNNAGIGSFGDLETISEAEWNKTLAVNVVGVAQVSALFTPLLREAVTKAPDISPRIITITSIAAFATAMPGMAPYQASKWAAQALTQSLNLELGPSGIIACTINPSFHRTPIFQNTWSRFLDSPMEREQQSKAVHSSERLAVFASQNHWDPKYVVNAIDHAVQGRAIDPVIPVGLDACMVLLPLNALPFSLFKFCWDWILNPITSSMAKEAILPIEEALKPMKKTE